MSIFLNVSEYVDELKEKTCVIPKDSALMFCYFNNNELFHKYLDQFEGVCLILVGPVDGARHCDPEPAYLEVRAWNFDQVIITLLRIILTGNCRTVTQ